MSSKKIGAAKYDNTENGPVVRINVKARNCAMVTPDVCELELFAVPMDIRTTDILEDVFPHTMAHVEKLLAIETLIAALRPNG